MQPPAPGGRLRRILWFVAIYAASVGALGLVALGVRALLKP